jgi:hypothetical protein
LYHGRVDLLAALGQPQLKTGAGPKSWLRKISQRARRGHTRKKTKKYKGLATK